MSVSTFVTNTPQRLMDIIRDPAFIRTIGKYPQHLMETQRLLETRHLLEVLRYVKIFMTKQ